MMSESKPTPKHFIQQIIDWDLSQGHCQRGIVTRFPPEPNGYLHIGHAKSICLNFGMAREYRGACNLRFDDTNPTQEDVEFTNAIQADVKWLGATWDGEIRYASDYFEQLFQFAVQLIKQGAAFVCSLNADKIRDHRGTLQSPGKDSPYRHRSVEENLDLFHRMRQGEFTEGVHVLRAKIDMQSGNISLRDPVIYRILHATHHRTGNSWCIYPLYDFAHPLSDALEGITHSLCTLEFQANRPLYNWFLEQLCPKPHPQQIEFSRLNLSHTVTSKRKLKYLVENNLVSGWDDPRMPTLIGLKRRGYPPRAIQQFCSVIGISKSDSLIDMTLLEECVRNELNETAPRAMGVLDPLKVTITNFPKDTILELQAPLHPQHSEMGDRKLVMTSEIFIDRNDFMENPTKGFFRLSRGAEVRLRYGHIIRCDEIIKNETNGEITELKCSYDPDTLGKNPVGRKVKGIIHWVSATHNMVFIARLYERLFDIADPGSIESWDELVTHLNPHSLTELRYCIGEQNLQQAAPMQAYQFERLGYFCLDSQDSTVQHKIFNRIATLRDSSLKNGHV